MIKEKAIRIGYDSRGVYVDVNGEGTVKQSNSLKKILFNIMEKFKGIKEFQFYMNLTNCQYVDSTFIGLVLIVNKKLKESVDKNLIIIKPGGYVLDVIKQMGLENILTITQDMPEFPKEMQELEIEGINKLELAMMMYYAHSELADLNNENKKKFENAVNMLKKEIENEGIDLDKNHFSIFY